ncbi:hypothetical protein C6P45_004445 [Maudiozyma exigua]|uniref:Uncharacterized protein n=1 Tax=Maudiozyma exigua TaxID=34358 RepID=A0A9P6WGF7_MAUEX|nr:hypothetical protein C6P45_004445 [Kazachstania exigua]
MSKHTSNDTESMPPDDELPSYEDVIKQEQEQSQSQSNLRPPTHHSSNHSSHSTSQLNSSTHSRPPAPPRPNKPSKHGSTGTHTNSSGPRIPWIYPSGFYCPKCNNTGYKTKNGKSCKSCWRRFAHQNNVSMAPSSYGYYQSSPIYQQPQQMYQQPMQSNRPLYVRPGDPRIGGVICGNCRGTGRIRFLLDDDICTLCHGLGRIIT